MLSNFVIEDEEKCEEDMAKTAAATTNVEHHQLILCHSSRFI